MSKKETDIEKFVKLYKSVGIDLQRSFVERDNLPNAFEELSISNNDDNEKIGGYRDFETTITFDKKGKFIIQEIWE